MSGCRAEVVNGEVQVAGPSSATPGQSAQADTKQAVTSKEFEVPSQLRQQFIEVRQHTGSLFCRVRYLSFCQRFTSHDELDMIGLGPIFPELSVLSIPVSYLLATQFFAITLLPLRAGAL